MLFKSCSDSMQDLGVGACRTTSISGKISTPAFIVSLACFCLAMKQVKAVVRNGGMVLRLRSF